MHCKITELEVESENNVVYKIIYHFGLRTLLTEMYAHEIVFNGDPILIELSQALVWLIHNLVRFDLSMFTCAYLSTVVRFSFHPVRANLFAFFSSADTFAREISDIHD